MNPFDSKRLEKGAAVALALGLSLFVFAGCGPSKVAKEQLDTARKTYAHAKADPNVGTLAPTYLADAEKALRDAEQAGGSTDMIHRSYLAEKKARVAMAFAEGRAAEAETRKLNEETAALIARKQELDRAREAEKRKALMDAEQSRLAAASEAERAAKAKMEAEQARMAAAAEAERAAKAKMEAEQAQLAARTEAERAARAQADAEQLMKELSELKAKQTERGIVLTIGDVLFAFGKADLSPKADRNVDKLVDFLKKYSNRSVLIEGHTDSIGSEEYNLGLSRERAASVTAKLVADGIASGRITAVGYGEKYPSVANDTEANRAMNRRVEVIILHEGVDPKTQLRE